MGVLDDLRTQAQGQREREESDAAEAAHREQFYRDEIQPRMTKAYQYFMELVEHLNYVNLDTPVDYPLWPDGKPETLHQGDYMVVIDSSQAVKRIDVNFQGKLDKPLEFEIRGREAVLRHADRLDRYHIKYERRDHKDTNLDLIGGTFKIEGPLPLKVVISADVLNGVVQLVFRNFSDPGVSRYSIQPKEFDDAFLDRLGQFMLRKVDKLFTLAMDDSARDAIRRRLQEEQALRDQEMREAEERWQAEEAARLANSTKEQIKNTVLKTVDENKERLKGIFDKLKKQTKAPQQTPPVQSAPQTMPAASKPLTKPAQPHHQVAVKKGMSAQTNTSSKLVPPVPEPTGEQVREQAAPAAKRQIPQPKPIPAEAPTQSTSVSPASLKTATEPVGIANSKPASSASPTAVPTAAVKKTKPPKVHNAAPPNNPFLKPESPVAPPVVETAERETKPAAEQPKLEATPAADSSPRPDLTPESLEEDLARIIERDKQNMPQQTPDSKKTSNPFLQTPSTKVAAQTATTPATIEHSKPYLKPGELNTSLSGASPITRQAVSAKDATASEAKNSTQNPFLKPDELDIDLSGEENS